MSKLVTQYILDSNILDKMKSTSNSYALVLRKVQKSRMDEEYVIS